MQTTRTPIDEIAHRHLGLDTLEERGSDSLDFHELPVWDIRTALAAAFAAGAGAHLRELASGSSS